MNTWTNDMERKSVSVWTPWGEQKLAHEDSRKSTFRRKLEMRRARKERKPANCQAIAPRD